MKGSKVIDFLPHSGHTRVDLYCPWNLSTMTLSLRALWLHHASSATSSSGRLSSSLTSMYGLFCTRLRSSWSPSRRKARSSWESCWLYPTNCGAKRPTLCLKWRGTTTVAPGAHSFSISPAYASASSPPMPRGLVRLISDTWCPPRKYSISCGVWARHCRAEFMKHVFPRFCRPLRPRLSLCALMVTSSWRCPDIPEPKKRGPPRPGEERYPVAGLVPLEAGDGDAPDAPEASSQHPFTFSSSIIIWLERMLDSLRVSPSRSKFILRAW
mmetsp:Transcript_54043/g.171490  ORF Transcript_54043/g.171490 Transcript_54043/m.171490 type:complete len:269 (+) Transcript_54043:473-1279(+)